VDFASKASGGRLYKQNLGPKTKSHYLESLNYTLICKECKIREQNSTSKLAITFFKKPACTDNACCQCIVSSFETRPAKWKSLEDQDPNRILSKILVEKENNKSDKAVRKARKSSFLCVIVTKNPAGRKFMAALILTYSAQVSPDTHLFPPWISKIP
jgi:hypothetical protein